MLAAAAVLGASVGAVIASDNVGLIYNKAKKLGRSLTGQATTPTRPNSRDSSQMKSLHSA